MNTQTLECITCHDPHKLEQAPAVKAVQVCLKCHEQQRCGMQAKIPEQARLGCVDCHMPERPAVDTPIHTRDEDYLHLIVLTEHRIAVHPGATERYLLSWCQTQDVPEAQVKVRELAERVVSSEIEEGISFLRSRKYMAAICAFKAALKLRPDDARAQEGLTAALAGQKQVDQALAFNDFGFRLLEGGQPQEADVFFNKAIALEPELADAHLNRGLLFARMGRADEAIGHFEKALRLRPGYISALFNLGTAYLKRREFDAAIKQFRSLLDLNPHYPLAHCNLGVALGQKGKAAEAIRHYRECLRLLPEHGPAATYLAWILATENDENLRNGREAVALMESLRKRMKDPDPRVFDTLGAAYAESGDFRKAIDFAQAAVGLARQLRRDQFARELAARVKLYESGQPFRQIGGGQSRAP